MAIFPFSTYYAMGMNYWKEKLFDWSIICSLSLLCFSPTYYCKFWKEIKGVYETGANFLKKNVVQMNENDTHPTLCILELTRILMGVKGLSWKEVWGIT